MINLSDLQNAVGFALALLIMLAVIGPAIHRRDD